MIFPLCGTGTYTVCANRHIYLLTVLCCCVHMHHVCILCLVWRGDKGGGMRSVTLPTERAFILGLSEPTQGGIVGWWSETAPVAVPPSTPNQSSPDFVTPPPSPFSLSLTHTHTHTHKQSGLYVWLLTARYTQRNTQRGTDTNVVNNKLSVTC